MTQLAAHHVRGLLRHQAIHRQLAASDGHESLGAIFGVVDDLISPRKLVFVAPPFEQGRAHPGRRPDGPVAADRGNTPPNACSRYSTPSARTSTQSTVPS